MTKYNGRIYAGMAIIRHDSEDEYVKSEHGDRDKYSETVLGAYVHIFVDYAECPVDVEEVLLKPSLCVTGSSGVVVKYQKYVRDQAKIGQVTRWRESFVPDLLSDDERVQAGMSLVTGVDEETVEQMFEDDLIWYDDGNNPWTLEPFVVLNAKATSLNIPLTFEDKETIAFTTKYWEVISEKFGGAGAMAEMSENDPTTYKAFVIMAYSATV